MKLLSYALPIAISLTAALALTSAASSTGEGKPSGDHENYSSQCCSAEKPAPKVQIKKVTFKKDKVYEIAFFSVTKGKEAVLFEQYMPAAQPFFKKYGVEVVGMFGVTETSSKVLDAQKVAIFQWPNIEAKSKLMSDPGFQEVAKLREGAFSFFKAGWFAAPEDTEISFRSDKHYEIGGATLFKGLEAQANLGKYFEISGPIKKNYGGVEPKFLVMMSPTGTKEDSSYTHAMQFIVEWDSLEDKTKLFADEDFKLKALPLLHKAVETMDLVFAKFAF